MIPSLLLPKAMLSIPLLALALLSCLMITDKASERAVAQVSRWSLLTLSGLSLANTLFAYKNGPSELPLWQWYHLGHHAFHFIAMNDFITSLYATIFVLISATVGFFSQTYLHKDQGFVEFFVLIQVFIGAALLVVFAANMDTLFVGWELVSLCSVILIGFYRHRQGPTDNSFYTLVSYRFGEAFMLIGLTLAHISYGDTHFVTFAAQNNTSTSILALMVLAAFVKSAQLPFSGWLPRAMEGPTPSSAIFYGGLSSHLGPLLLIKIAPYVAGHSFIRAAIIICGLTTAAYAALIARTRADIKTQLAYATIAQLGLIFAEIGFGLPTLAIAHSLLHCCIRTFQFLKSPSVLYSFKSLHLERSQTFIEQRYPQKVRDFIYYLAKSNFLVDRCIEKLVLVPFSVLCSQASTLEKRLLKLDCLPEDSTSTLNTREKDSGINSAKEEIYAQYVEPV